MTGVGSLTHLGGDRWKVRIYAGRDHFGRQRLRSKTFRAKNEQAANRAMARYVAELQGAIEDRKAERLTVAGLVKDWLAFKSPDFELSTMRRTKIITDRIIADLGRIPLDSLTARHVDEWYARLRAENIGTADKPRYRSDSTVHHFHRVLHGILRQGERWEMVPKVATAKATPPKRPKRRPAIPPEGAVRLLLEQASPSVRFAAILAAVTGLRRGELVGLRWTDVEDDGLHVRRSIVDNKARTVKPPKTESGARVVGLAPGIRALLDVERARCEKIAAQRHGTLAPDAYILAELVGTWQDPGDPNGHKPRRPGWLTLAWRRLCDKHGARIRVHDLRHLHISALGDEHVPITAIAGRAGHSRNSTTLDIYSHESDEGRLVAAEAADRILARLTTNSSALEVRDELRR